MAYVLYPVMVLGPGKRVGIWLYGCNRRCKGCISPQLQEFNYSKNISVDRLIERLDSVLDNHEVDGITISGGEPFEQAQELDDFLEKISTKVKDVLLYTGYTIEELKGKESPVIENILKKVSVLIDGEYRENENKGHAIKGSENQRIIYNDDAVRQLYEQYIDCCSSKKRLQNFELSDGVFTVGIPEKGTMEKLEKQLHSGDVT